MSHTVKTIEQRAQELLRGARVTSTPVDLSKIAHFCNAEIHWEKMEADVSGALVVRGHERHIFVNQEHPEVRQRFTIGHEFGHLILHDTGDRMIVDKYLRIYQRVGEASSFAYTAVGATTTPQEEREANMFAAALLMPAPVIAAEALVRDISDEDQMQSLAQELKVSLQALLIRLQQLKVIESTLGAPLKQTTLFD